MRLSIVCELIYLTRWGQWNESWFAQLMSGRLLGTKPLPEQVENVNCTFENKLQRKIIQNTWYFQQKN